MTTLVGAVPTALQDSPGATLTVDLSAVAANTRRLADHTRSRLMAVVKADGFGHGALPVARTALASGAMSLGVTSLAEALALRSAGITAPILSWINPVSADFGAALENSVELAVPGIDHLNSVIRAAISTGLVAQVHLHVDTGMARDGAPVREWPLLCRRSAAAMRRGWLQVVGVMGHLGCAADPQDPCNASARTIFERAVLTASATGLRPRERHLASTAAILTDPASHYDLVRAGAGLVGIDPTRTTQLRPAMTLTAPVVTVREVPAGTHVGYGHAASTAHATRLALLPVGYADGVPRAASGHASVWLNGRRCPLIGLVSMDQVVVDVGHAPVRPGDVATLFGPGDRGEPTVRDWAGWAGTIEHEIVTGIGARVARRHVEPVQLGDVQLGDIQLGDIQLRDAQLRDAQLGDGQLGGSQ